MQKVLLVLKPPFRSCENESPAAVELLGSNFRLIPLSQVVRDVEADFRFVFPAETRTYPPPTFFGNLRPQTADHEQVTVATPAIEATCIENVIAVGKFDLMFLGDDAIHSDQVELTRDKFAEEYIEFAKADAKTGRIQVLVSEPVKRLETPSAVYLVGGATHNYVHWLTETLPKLLMIDRCPEFRDVPLLVDDALHPNIYEALDFFNVHNREVIKVSRLQPVHVKRMVIVSAPTYIPFEMRESASGARTKLSPKDIQFSPVGISAIQSEIGRLRPPSPNSDRKKVYLRRNNPVRQITNIRELEPLLAAAGFETIDPERLSFREQVDLFQSASCVICQAGAALGNLCLARPGCLFVTFAARSEHVNYRYFSQLATLLGHTLAYVVGNPCNDNGTAWSAHDDIRIDPADLKVALGEIESELNRNSDADFRRSGFVEPRAA